MSVFELAALLLSLAAVLGYVNHKVLRLPMTIGLMVLAVLLSLALVGVGAVHPPVAAWGHQLLTRMDFDETLLEGMLGFLLFAGALHVDLTALKEQRRFIAIAATLGVLLSTAVVGGLMWLVLELIPGVSLSLGWCFLFGALISPTDPIAVLGILKSLGVPRTLETKITGESLFNDGIGVVVFLVIASALGLTGGGGELGAGGVAKLFVTEAIGGAALGLLLGYVTYLLMRSLDDYHLEVLLTLALVAGGYALAYRLHLSGPIAMVVAGLLIGNTGRRLAMSERTRDRLDDFWELIDEILNAVLFVMIGLEILALSFVGAWLLAGLLAIAAALLGRLVAVGTAVYALKPFRTFTPRAIRMLTWGGLKGGISVALALSIPAASAPTGARELLLTMTYVVVIFSIVVQGLTLGPLARRWLAPAR